MRMVSNIRTYIEIDYYWRLLEIEEKRRNGAQTYLYLGYLTEVIM